MKLIRIAIFTFVHIVSIKNSTAQPPRLVLPTGHTNSIYCAVFSPDEKYILTASADNTVKLWNTSNGKLLTEYKGQTRGATNAAYCPDGKKIATSSAKGFINIWSVPEGKLLGVLEGHKFAINTVAFSPDGKFIISASADKMVSIWDAEKYKLVRNIEAHENGVTSAAYSPDGKLIVTGGLDKMARIWEAASGKLLQTLSGHTDNLNYAAFSPATPDDPTGGSRIVTASYDKSFIVWDSKTGKINYQVRKNKIISMARYSPDGNHLIICTGELVIIADAHTGNSLKELKTNSFINFTAIYNAAGRYVLSAGDNSAILWDAATGTIIRELKGYSTTPNSIACSPDGNFFATACSDSTIKLWNKNNGELIRELTGHTNGVISVNFSPDGKYLISSSYDNTAIIWDVAAGKFINNLLGHTSLVKNAIFTPNGNSVLTAAWDGFVVAWEFPLLKAKMEFNHNKSAIETVTCSPDSKKIVTTSLVGSSKVWQLKDGVQLLELDNEKNQALYAEYNKQGNQLLVAYRDSTIRMLDANTGAIIREIKTDKPYIRFAKYSSDEKLILTTLKDTTATILNVKSGKVAKELIGHSSTINDAQFFDDGKKVVTCSADNTSKVWDVSSGKLLYSFFSTGHDDYINYLPSGYYKATSDASKLLHYVTNNYDVIGFEQLDVKYNRPDKVLEAIGNTDTALIKSYRKAYEKRIKKLGIDTTASRDGYSVPKADFANRNNIEYEQKNGMLELRIKGSDDTYTLDRFNAWVNETPLFGQRGINIRKKNKNDFDTTITINLSQGENIIEASISNINGTESCRIPLQVKYTPANPVKESIRFIGIGIDKFSDSQYNLEYSSKDIRDLAKKLKEKYKDNIIIDTLFNENVTVSSVKALKLKLQQTSVNDKVIVSYSGHGMLSKDFDYYLSTYTVNFKKPEENGLAYDELENLLDNIPARKKLMLIDACHSGEVDKEEGIAIQRMADSLGLTKGIIIDDSTTQTQQLGLKNSFELMQSLFVNVGKSTGATIISAAAGNQFALERGDLKNGVFTYSILEAMEKNQTMKISELKKIVGERVEQLTNEMQKPTSRNETIAVDWKVW